MAKVTKPKTAQWTLSIDPASRAAGVSIWLDSEYIGSQALNSKLRTWTQRTAEMRAQLREFVLDTIPKGETITQIVIESIPRIVEPSVQLVAGALIADSMYQSDITRKYFVSVSSWKAYARRNGAVDKDPKGMKALKEIGFPHEINSDDVADSILIYLCWIEKNQ